MMDKIRCDACGKDMEGFYGVEVGLNASKSPHCVETCQKQVGPYEINREYKICFECMLRAYGVKPKGEVAKASEATQGYKAEVAQVYMEVLMEVLTERDLIRRMQAKGYRFIERFMFSKDVTKGYSQADFIPGQLTDLENQTSENLALQDENNRKLRSEALRKAANCAIDATLEDSQAEVVVSTQRVTVPSEPKEPQATLEWVLEQIEKEKRSMDARAFVWTDEIIPKIQARLKELSQ